MSPLTDFSPMTKCALVQGAEDPFNLQIFFSLDLEAQNGFLSPDSNL